MRRALVLGGTAEASALARRLVAGGTWAPVTSLAGRTARPVLPPGEVRIGGFGGAAGLAEHLRAGGYHAVIDATHPFAAVMRWHAADAAGAAGLPRLRLERPGWIAGPGDRWQRVPTLAAAGEVVAASPWRRVLVTTGRSDLGAYTPAADGRRWWLVRSVDPPGDLPLAPAEVVLGRGPWDADEEEGLLRRHRIDAVVTKDSGGPAGKLEAARRLGLPVVVVDRPASPAGPRAADVEGALRWLAQLAG